MEEREKGQETRGHEIDGSDMCFGRLPDPRREKRVLNRAPRRSLGCLFSTFPTTRTCMHAHLQVNAGDQAEAEMIKYRLAVAEEKPRLREKSPGLK
ncbi:hypothetical protein SRHO_G00114250 [Serrasalmus rhombeus]